MKAGRLDEEEPERRIALIYDSAKIFAYSTKWMQRVVVKAS